MVLKNVVVTASLLSLVSCPLYAMDIDKCLPGVFEQNSGIKVNVRTFNGVKGYEIQKFEEEEKNRNHWDSRNKSPIQCLVMHYTVGNLKDTLQLFTANIPDGRASAHYVVSQKEKRVNGGLPFQVVPEDQRSWHAGLSWWRNVENLNASSIGIENVNQGYTGNYPSQLTWYPFDPDQIKTLGLLSQDIIKRYRIPSSQVIGHADIAPDRKKDPGILFPWGQLYETYGVGMWLSEKEQNSSVISTQYIPEEPLPQGISKEFISTYLEKVGYNPKYLKDNFDDVVMAFKAHFSHNQLVKDYNAILDENIMLWSWGLAAKYPRLK